MALVAKKGNDQPDNRVFVPSIRSILYLIVFLLIFCLTCVELGLVSQQIHKYGRYAENYASLQYKNAIGLLLCATLVSLILCLAHYWVSIGVTIMASLILAVFFGTVAGIFRITTPFRGTHCGRGQDAYPEKWRPYYKECSRIVTMEAIAWSLWGLYLMLLVGSLAYRFRISSRPTPGKFYWSPSRHVPSKLPV